MDKDLTLEERVTVMESNNKQKSLLSVPPHNNRLPNWTTQVIVIGLGVMMLFNINARAGALESRVISLESQVLKLAEIEDDIAAVEDELTATEAKAHNLEMVLDDILKAIGHRLPRRR